VQTEDPAAPLPFPDSAFDDVIASLGLHYLEDWRPTPAAFQRVLLPGGRLIASVDHPFAVHLRHRKQGQLAIYFETSNGTFE
jgi:SAM-dependent methyltransferase